MNITLTPELEEFVNRKLESGRYPSVDALVQQALLVMREHDAIYEEKVNELRAEIDLGIAELDSGQSLNRTARQILAALRSRQSSDV